MEMDDLYVKLQVLLLRKDQECGTLRFLTSRTTAENNEQVQDVCDSIGEILQSHEIPIEADASTKDPRCVGAYKYLLLNTFFECQEHLAEDPVDGHLVDMCPPLSPYLLSEILWSLRYEGIVAESLLHVPLDLCVEIVEISRRCSSLLDFPRRLEFVTALTRNCYKKLQIIGKMGTQTMELNAMLERLFMHLQELTALLSDEKFTRLEEVSGLKKSERLGLILKKALELMRDCLESSSTGVETSTEIESIYKITFGRAAVHRPHEAFANQLRMMNQEFVDVALKIMKEIDCNTYLGWASLESAGNSRISLQQSIGNDCYRCIEFMKSYEDLSQYDHLIEILQQFSSKPPAEPSFAEFDLEELRKSAEDGNRECLKEMMNRYNEWDHETFDVVQKQKSLIDKDDFSNLLEYLTLVMTKPGQEEHKRNVYATVTQVLMLQNIPDVFETTLEYIMKHDARNTLESPSTEQSFDNFIAHSRNFRSPQNLRLLMFFLLKNPRKILGKLVRISIGDDDYANVMISPQDMIILSPVMKIREKHGDTLIIEALRRVCIESVEWNGKKFVHLVQIMLENNVFTVDALVNNAFVPFLKEEEIAITKLRCVLNCLRKFASNCTRETNFLLLLEVIGRRMSILRHDPRVPKCSTNEALSMITRIVEILLRKMDNWPDEERRPIAERMNTILEPIDKPHFVRLLLERECDKIDVTDIIDDYRRRCFLAMNRVATSREIVEENATAIEILRCFDDDFLRYVILKSTETEYVRYATRATIFYGNYLRCKDAYDTYDKIVRVTVEACAYCSEFPARNSPDSLACLLKGLSRLTRSLSRLLSATSPEQLHRSLVDGLRKLDEFVNNSVFSKPWTTLVLLINNRGTREPARELLIELAQAIDYFANECLKICHDQVPRVDRSCSVEVTRYKIACDFIAECMSVNDDENYQSLCNIYKLLCSREQTDD